jgi:hypothetical protein
MKTLIASLALACCATLAQAAPPSDESIEQLMELTGTARMLDHMEGMIEPMMRKVMADSQQEALQHGGKGTLTPEQQAVLDAIPTKFAALIREELAWDKMKPAYVRIYRESFEQDEIDGLIAFYQSPAGQAMVRKMPTVMAKSMDLTQAQMRTLMPKLNGLMRESMAEMRAAKPQQ